MGIAAGSGNAALGRREVRSGKVLEREWTAAGVVAETHDFHTRATWPEAHVATIA